MISGGVELKRMGPKIRLDKDLSQRLLFNFGPIALIMAFLWAKSLVFSAGLPAEWHSDSSIALPAVAATVMLLFAPLTLLSHTGRFASALMLDVLFSTILVADLIYFRFFEDLISVSEFVNPLQLGIILPSAVAALKPTDWLYYGDVVLGIALLPVYIRAGRHIPPLPKIWMLHCSILLLTLGSGLLAPTLWLGWKYSDEALTNRALLGELAGKIGIVPYHIYDAAIHLTYPTSDGVRASGSEIERIRSFIEGRAQNQGRSELFGIARDRNVIVLSAESLNLYPIGLSINSQAVMPFLSAFVRESLYFTNFFDQTYRGTTSDAEFMAMQSLYPLPAGYVPHRYVSTYYHALPAILSERGYSTLSATGEPGWVWNMTEMHPRLGFQQSYFEESYAVTERIGQWLADEEFFSQTIPILNSQRPPFMAFLLTSSNHSPFKVPQKHRVLELGALEGTVLGDYIHSVHYFDRAFGHFIARLRDAGLLDKSIVILYGDHQGFVGNPPELLRLLGFPEKSEYHRFLVRKKVPLIIRLPHGVAAGVRPVVGGHVDIAPTILGLLGIPTDKVMLGRDLTLGESSPVVFRDGSFVDGKHFFNYRGIASNSNCYETNAGRLVGCESLKSRHVESLERLKMSDLIIRRNLIPALISWRPPLRLVELSDPTPYSAEFGVRHVKIVGLDLHAHPPSGAKFSVKTGGEPVQLIFTPSFVPSVPRDKTDGVTFEVWCDGERIYQRHVLPTERVDPVTLNIAGGNRGTAQFSFVTSPGPRNNPTYDWAMWRNVKVVVGSVAAAFS